MTIRCGWCSYNPMTGSFDFIMIGAYFALLLAAGFAFKHLNRNISDYFRSGCRGTWWLAGTSLFMSGLSAVTFTANAGVAYTAGWSILAVYIGGSITSLLHVLLAPRFRRLRAITGPEIMRMRFGPVTQQIYAWLGPVTSMPGGAFVLWGLAVFCCSVFKLPVHETIIVLGLTVLVYSTAGGKWAVMATDVIQALVLIPVAILLATRSLGAMGGLRGMFERIDAAGLTEPFRVISAENGNYSWKWALGLLFITFVSQIHLGAASRYFSVKDDREATRTALWNWLLATLGMGIWFLPPVAARLLFADMVEQMPISRPEESAYAVAAMQLLPAGTLGVMIAAMFSATMSSLDSAINANAALFARDIYPALCRRFGREPAEGERLLRISRFFNILFGLGVIALALYFSTAGGSGIFETMMELIAVLGMPMVVPLVFCLFIKKSPAWAALFSLGCTYATSLGGKALFPDWPFYARALANFAAGAGVYLITLPFWRNSTEAYKARVMNFYALMRTPVDFEKEVGEANDGEQMRVIGLFALLTGGLLSLLVFIPNPPGDRAALGGIAAAVLLVGATLRRAGRSD